ncbi:DUF58 domain-containing protein [Rapidithrix thailandica]|uniref:DUF58 domain-containing protein n=1 Tax=Rapidithrix thailandica TaxID=413964 RepID=A0AAW9S668_9BACT
MDFDLIKKYGKLELLARQMVEGFITGLHKSPYHGFSVEFAEHNLYNTGESTRHIDWKVYAKTDRLYTKRYEEETNLRCMILVDTSSSMYYPAATQGKIHFSIMASACLAFMLQKQRDAVGLCSFSDKIEDISQVRSTGSHVRNLFVTLQNMVNAKPQQQKTAVADVIHEVAQRIHKRSLVIIFSDMMENETHHKEMFSALQHLKHNNHEVLLFHVYDKKTELDFDFPERPTVFIDLETGQKEKAQPAQVKEYYQKKIHQRFQEIKYKCGQFKIDFIEVDIQHDIDQILQAYLIKRARMK